MSSYHHQPHLQLLAFQKHRYGSIRTTTTTEQSNFTSHYEPVYNTSTSSHNSRYCQEQLLESFNQLHVSPTSHTQTQRLPSSPPHHHRDHISGRQPLHLPPPSSASTHSHAGTGSSHRSRPSSCSRSDDFEGTTRLWIRGGNRPRGSGSHSSSSKSSKKSKNLYLTWKKPNKDARKEYYWVRPR